MPTSALNSVVCNPGSILSVFFAALTRPRQTIRQLTNAEWPYTRFVFYFAFGSSFVFDAELLSILGYDASLKGILLSMIVVVIVGTIAGLGYRLLWVFVLYYTGKIWKGTATFGDIDTVLALSVAPALIEAGYAIALFLTSGGHPDVAITHPGVSVVCAIFGLRTLIIGLSAVQRFSYGMAVLNFLLPCLVFVLIIGLIRYS